MSASTSKGVLPLVLLVALLVALALSISSAGPVSASPSGPTAHDPIHIEGDDDFTPANGVTSGSGTAGDPYIIEDWVIDASSANGIRIENTTKYFVIRNCLVENGRPSYHGIYLDNVKNGRIENNTCRNNIHGIFLSSSSYDNLTNNTCENNSSYSIYLYLYSSYNNLTSNTCSNNGWGICLWDSSYNNLTNNTCENNGGGIRLPDSSYNNLTNNTCSNNSTGIDLWESSSNTISSNTCENNGWGICLWDSSYNNLTNNTCSNNSRDGIFLCHSSYDNLTNNTCENNSSYNFGVFGSDISHFDHDIDTSNLVDGRPIYYLKDTSDLVIGPSLNAGYLGLVRCDNIRVENLVLENNGQGILLASTENSWIENCVCSNNECGIFLILSSYDNLINNTCENNGDGIFLTSSNNNTLTNNTCENNRWNGISLSGIISLSSNNTISNNTCENNSRGIWLVSSSNNTIFHNYLLNNTENNAYDDNTNFWDENGEGNYWDDWQPPEHPDADGDGIVDEPRPIAGGTNQDDYPLVIPSKPFPWALMIGLIVTVAIIITAGIVIYRRH